MNNILDFEEGYKAVISYDSELEMFRGEFLGLNGGADFYATDTQGLKREGATSLRIFLDECRERGIAPKKKEGRFPLRLDGDLYHHICSLAKAKHMSINSFIEQSLRDVVSR